MTVNRLPRRCVVLVLRRGDTGGSNKQSGLALCFPHRSDERCLSAPPPSTQDRSCREKAVWRGSMCSPGMEHLATAQVMRQQLPLP